VKETKIVFGYFSMTENIETKKTWKIKQRKKDENKFVFGSGA